MTAVQFHPQKSDAVLELAVLGGVDERVDDAVGEHHHRRQVVVPASEVGRNSVESDDNNDVVRRDAHDEPTADDQ